MSHNSHFVIRPSSLTAPTPHTLQQPIPLREPIHTIVALPHTPHESTQRVHLILPGISTILVHFAHADLYARVIFGFDDPVGRGAFAWDVAS